MFALRSDDDERLFGMHTEMKKVSGFLRGEGAVGYDDAVDAGIFRCGVGGAGDIEPLRQTDLAATHPRRFDDLEVGHSLGLGNVAEHLVDADESVASVGDGSAGGDDFNERHELPSRWFDARMSHAHTIGRFWPSTAPTDE